MASASPLLVSTNSGVRLGEWKGIASVDAVAEKFFLKPSTGFSEPVPSHPDHLKGAHDGNSGGKSTLVAMLNHQK